jgi:hypothetical protein
VGGVIIALAFMVLDEAAAEMVGVSGGASRLQSFEKRYLSSLVRRQKKEKKNKKNQRMQTSKGSVFFFLLFKKFCQQGRSAIIHKSNEPNLATAHTVK